VTTPAEARRLEEARTRQKHWKRWGPYVSERAWGTVREDYSPGGTAWDSFPHDHARSRAYRWNEDGLAGICDRHQRVCFALALWNGRDPILKERLFGLNGNEGNHGEDVKEYYFYLDNTPTHSYMRYLYKYPQAAFPYAQLIEENRRRGKHEGEYELVDTGVFDDNRYFDVVVTYAKADVEDMLIAIDVTNRASEAATIDVLPTIWFRNTWSWHSNPMRPQLGADGASTVLLHETMYGDRWLHADGTPELLFTENETNASRVFGFDDGKVHTKDAFHRYVVEGETGAVNPARTGTKAAVRYRLDIPAGATVTLRLRLNDRAPQSFQPFGRAFDAAVEQRRREADEFYATIIPVSASADAQRVARQAFAGLLWSKQYYHYVVKPWLDGDASQPAPPASRHQGRNREWTHLYNADVISMPDKWEYPWYAAWDLAFHCVPLALVDSDFAKEQLVLLLREWYMHPNGQLPAYEWAFGDVNPPVHAWAAWRVYKIEKKHRGEGDLKFLARVFHKLLLNFTWWVNRKDAEGMNVFQGGFLGLDNIGVFDRSAPLPTGGHLEQSDGTSWMAMYALNMLAIAMELANHDPAYEDVASKFWEHFLNIAHAMSGGRLHGGEGHDLWNEEDGFFYDVLHLPDDSRLPLKIRSLVGLIPMLAVQTLEPGALAKHDGFRRRLEWFVQHRPDLTDDVACMETPGKGERRLLSILDGDRLRRVLSVMLDEREFLSPYGIRAISQRHRDEPYVLNVDGHDYRVAYEPGESSTGLFGGNSNWRGPIWMPINFLLVESLQKFHHYFGDEFKVECPTGSGRLMTLGEVADEISRRLSAIFVKDANGRRAVFGRHEQFQQDPLWSELIPFYEYFHGDTGAGVGASHQTGWTALVAKLLQQTGAIDEGRRSQTRKTKQRAPRGVVETVAV
jgi:Mannosylglycerate hydrolase MGH1-like glycoside hydrolase domain/Glycosyl hydrolase family 63 C-terminal domain